MRKRKLILMFIMLCSFVGYSQSAKHKKANKETQAFRYDIECAGTGVNGTYLVKVWSYSKKTTIALEQSKKNAVHGVIFKGFSSSAANCKTQKPLATNATIEQEQADFFNKFFSDGGQYMKYVTSSAAGNTEIIKVGKEYKVGVVISVSKDLLRKDLEDAEIIKGLSSGF